MMVLHLAHLNDVNDLNSGMIYHHQDDASGATFIPEMILIIE